MEFQKGMDLSFIPELEDAGVQVKDFDGTIMDPLDLVQKYEMCIRDRGTLFAVFDVALVRCVIFKLGVQDTSSFGGSHEDSTETNQASCRDFELQTGGTIACAAHAVKLAFTLAEELDDSTGELVRNVNVCDFHWLEFASALVLFVDNLCLTYCELISLTAHVFDQDGQMQLTTAGNLEAVCGISLLDTQGNVGVQLTHQTVAQVAGGNVSVSYTHLPTRCRRS